ncbi:conserved hypothetical protein fragment 1 [Helicobacter acinonychis str. Sheeba]|uniref:Uncharacterized protein n=1 Tax=Helicobacter acinonychis (strain Sheeba) TaxID=382638 RepID=Q17VR1_HELAH|nr:conserved hypothetical protein fragment 1 [Helicobacter acinonychis str. Sheeba]
MSKVQMSTERFERAFFDNLEIELERSTQNLNQKIEPVFSAL